MLWFGASLGTFQQERAIEPPPASPKRARARVAGFAGHAIRQVTTPPQAAPLVRMRHTVVAMRADYDRAVPCSAHTVRD
jgi:hypothetical protein